MSGKEKQVVRLD